jgi:hypothetical protein
MPGIDTPPAKIVTALRTESGTVAMVSQSDLYFHMSFLN